MKKKKEKHFIYINERDPGNIKILAYNGKQDEFVIYNGFKITLEEINLRLDRHIRPIVRDFDNIEDLMIDIYKSKILSILESDVVNEMCDKDYFPMEVTYCDGGKKIKLVI